MDKANKRVALCPIVLMIGLVFLPLHGNKRGLSLDEEKSFTKDRGQGIAADSEGNVYVCGYSYGEKNDYDYVTIKYNSNGKQIWASRYNGPANSSDYAQDLTLDRKGNIYVTGHSNGQGTSLDCTTLKYNPHGKLLWVKRYDGPAHRDDWAYHINADETDHIIVAGYSFGKGTEHDYVAIKYNDNGKELWVSRYNPPRNRDDIVNDLVLDKKGNVYITGIDRARETSYDATTVKYNPKGHFQWLAKYSGPEDTFDASHALAVDPKGYTYITGYSYEKEGGANFITVKYDSKGNTVWTAKYNGPFSSLDAACDIVVDDSSHVYVTGKSRGEETAADLVTIKHAPTGEILWLARYDGPGHGADIPVCMGLDPNNHVIISGYSRSKETGRDYLTVKYGPEGDRLWTKHYDGSPNDTVRAQYIDKRGYVYITGYCCQEETNSDFLTIKLDQDGNLLWTVRFDEQLQKE